MTWPRTMLLIGALALAACATRQGPPSGPSDPIEGAISQPFRDLSLIRDPLPSTLAKAAAAPYGLDARSDCAKLADEIAELDRVLGPDLDATAEKPAPAGEVVSEAVRSALGLPFRGVIRRLSGAAERDRVKAHAVLAGMIRRGFLKGTARAMACAPASGAF